MVALFGANQSAIFLSSILMIGSFHNKIIRITNDIPIYFLAFYSAAIFSLFFYQFNPSNFIKRIWIWSGFHLFISKKDRCEFMYTLLYIFR